MAHRRPPAALAQPGSTPIVIAHRGGSLEAPENTLAAVRHGIASGSAWQEVDVTLSQDGRVVVMHDDTVDRTTEGQGAVDQLPWAVLAQLRTGAPRWAPEGLPRLAALGVQLPEFGAAFADERVPLLEEVLRLPDARIMVELKTTPRPKQLAEAVVGQVRRTGMGGRAVLGSFDLPTLAAVAACDADIVRLGILEDMAVLQPMLDLGVAAVAVDFEIAAEIVRRVPPHVAVWTWTIYTPAQAQAAAAAGVHGVIADIPAQLARRWGGAADAAQQALGKPTLAVR